MDPSVGRIQQLLKAAQARHGKPALQRMQQAFWRLTGFERSPPPAHPMQRPTHVFPGLTATPWPDPELLPGIALLERHASRIRDELDQAQSALQGFDDGTPHSGQWQAIHLRYGAQTVERNRSLCPFTSQLIESLPGVGEMAMVSRLAPGAHIKPHCGVNNSRYTVHLGLHVPPGCWFRVADEVRPWHEGRCLLFDDSFEHEAMNPSQQYREVLLVDFWHPELTPAETQLLQQVAALLASQRSRTQPEVAK